MKKILLALATLFLCHNLWAQENKTPIMTAAFSDSLKNQISNIITPHYTIKISYQSTISAEGKLLKPLIRYEAANGTTEDNEFVQKLRLLIINAPAWTPAAGSSPNANAMVLFDVNVKDGQISITNKTP